MIKPDAVEKNVIGKIIACYEEAGFSVVAFSKKQLTKKKAEVFYAVHRERPFYGELTDFMSSSPMIALVLEGDDVIAKNRELMGATNPEEAMEGTIRKQFATNIERNAVHGSDSVESAKQEIPFFFSDLDLLRANS